MPAREPTTVPSERAGQLRAYISDAGFTVDIEPDAGLVARATPPTVEAFCRGPAELGNLGPLIGDLAALAAAEGSCRRPRTDRRTTHQAGTAPARHEGMGLA